MNTSKTRAKTAGVLSSITTSTRPSEEWSTKCPFLLPRRNEHPVNLITFPSTLERNQSQWLPPTLPVPKISHSAKRYAKTFPPLINLSSIPSSNMSPLLPSKVSSRFIRPNRYRQYNGSKSAKVDPTSHNSGTGAGTALDGDGKKKIIKSNLKKKTKFQDNREGPKLQGRGSRAERKNGGNEETKIEKTLTINDFKTPSAEGKSLLDHPTLDPNIRLTPVQSLTPVGKKSGSSSNGLMGERMQVIRTEEEKIRNPDSIRLDRCGLKQFPLISHTSEPQLRLLSLQHNLITRLENVPSLNHLVVLDLYDNRIERINFHGLNSLRVLLLGKNRIRRVEGLEGLKRLEVLDLHGNQLRYVDNLGCLLALRVLNLAGNNFKTIRLGSYSLLSLVELNLKRNRIRNLEGLQKAPHLKKLLLANNELTSTSCLFPLRKLIFLQELLFEPNPLCTSADYVNHVLTVFPWLEILDRSHVTDLMRAEAKIWHRKHLADEEAKKTEQSKSRSIVPTSREEIIYEARRRWQSVKNFVKNKDPSNGSFGGQENSNDELLPDTTNGLENDNKKNMIAQAQLEHLFDLNSGQNLHCANPNAYYEELHRPVDDTSKINHANNNSTPSTNLIPEIFNSTLTVDTLKVDTFESQIQISDTHCHSIPDVRLPNNEISTEEPVAKENGEQQKMSRDRSPISRDKSTSKIAIVHPIIRTPDPPKEQEDKFQDDFCKNKIEIEEEIEECSTKTTGHLQEKLEQHKNKSKKKLLTSQISKDSSDLKRKVEEMKNFIMQQLENDAIVEVEEDNSDDPMCMTNRLGPQQEDEEEEEQESEDKFEVVQQNEADFMDETSLGSDDGKTKKINYNNLNLNLINQNLPKPNDSNVNDTTQILTRNETVKKTIEKDCTDLTTQVPAKEPQQSKITGRPERGPLKRSMSSFSLGPPLPIPNLSSSNSAQNINKLTVSNNNNIKIGGEGQGTCSNFSKNKLNSLRCHRSSSFDVRFPSSGSDSSDDASSVLTMNTSECGVGGRGSRKLFPNRNRSKLKRERLTSSKLQTNGGLNSSRRPLTGIRGEMNRGTNPNRPLKRCDSAVSEISPSSLTATMKKQGADFLVEIDGKILNVYGQGALKYTLMGFPSSLTSNVTTAKFHYISYDTIIPYFGKFTQVYPGLTNIIFRANNISTLAQLNALADLQGLSSLHIAKEGNPLAANELWPNYASYRLSHWGLQNIAKKEYGKETAEYRGSLTTSAKVFESLGYIALSCLPQTALTPLAKRLHTLHCFCCCSPSSSSDDSTGRRKNGQNGGTNEPAGNPCTSWDDDPVLLDVIGKEALVYAPPIHDKEKQAERIEIPEKILNSGVEILEKLDMLDKIWPSLFQEVTQDILMDYLLLDNNYMKKEFKKVQLSSALLGKKIP